MRSLKQQRRARDHRVTLGLLALANLICVVGLVYEYSLLSAIFALIGVAGLFAAALSIGWLGTVLLDYAYSQKV